MWPFNRRKEQQEFVSRLGFEQTPDVAALEESKYRLLFVCDDMKRAHINNKIIMKHSEQVGRGFTADKFDFRIGKHTGKGLPFVSPSGLKVKGEIYKVISQLFAESLDKHYGNGVEFARVRVPILVVDRDHRLIEIGGENFIRKLGPGAIRTVPELGVRHYLSNQRTSILRAEMYVAIKKYWVNTLQGDGLDQYAQADVKHPKDKLIWLPKYYNYPINRNRCLK